MGHKTALVNQTIVCNVVMALYHQYATNMLSLTSKKMYTRGGGGGGTQVYKCRGCAKPFFGFEICNLKTFFGFEIL